eukprot:GHVN01020555.1.p1 GENE.GHVN01020555.1~~GHVN01020555.1.p1  ORF type:complete len:840 (+),score=82.92 GHVN01020555.1:648-3167(+)
MMSAHRNFVATPSNFQQRYGRWATIRSPARGCVEGQQRTSPFTPRTAVGTVHATRKRYVTSTEQSQPMPSSDKRDTLPASTHSSGTHAYYETVHSPFTLPAIQMNSSNTNSMNSSIPSSGMIPSFQGEGPYSIQGEGPYSTPKISSAGTRLAALPLHQASAFTAPSSQSTRHFTPLPAAVGAVSSVHVHQPNQPHHPKPPPTASISNAILVSASSNLSTPTDSKAPKYSPQPQTSVPKPCISLSSQSAVPEQVGHTPSLLKHAPQLPAPPATLPRAAYAHQPAKMFPTAIATPGTHHSYAYPTVESEPEAQLQNANQLSTMYTTSPALYPQPSNTRLARTFDFDQGGTSATTPRLATVTTRKTTGIPSQPLKAGIAHDEDTTTLLSVHSFAYSPVSQLTPSSTTSQSMLRSPGFYFPSLGGTQYSAEYIQREPSHGAIPRESPSSASAKMHYPSAPFVTPHFPDNGQISQTKSTDNLMKPSAQLNQHKGPNPSSLHPRVEAVSYQMRGNVQNDDQGRLGDTQRSHRGVSSQWAHSTQASRETHRPLQSSTKHLCSSTTLHSCRRGAKTANDPSLVASRRDLNRKPTSMSMTSTSGTLGEEGNFQGMRDITTSGQAAGVPVTRWRTSLHGQLPLCRAEPHTGKLPLQIPPIQTRGNHQQVQGGTHQPVRHQHVSSIDRSTHNPSKGFCQQVGKLNNSYGSKSFNHYPSASWGLLGKERVTRPAVADSAYRSTTRGHIPTHSAALLDVNSSSLHPQPPVSVGPPTFAEFAPCCIGALTNRSSRFKPSSEIHESRSSSSPQESHQTQRGDGLHLHNTHVQRTGDQGGWETRKRTLSSRLRAV